VATDKTTGNLTKEKRAAKTIAQQRVYASLSLWTSPHLLSQSLQQTSYTRDTLFNIASQPILKNFDFKREQES
jgi:hypothetical protein